MAELSIQDIANQLNIAPITVENWIKAGFLKGNSAENLETWRISDDDFQRFIEYERDKTIVHDDAGAAVEE